MEDREIAKELGISYASVSGYVYKAGKNGWLDLDNPKDRLEHQTMHKIIKNLEEALESQAVLQTGMKESTAVALKMAEGTLFKKFDEAKAETVQQTVVAVRIEMPQGPVQQMREETIGGTPAYIDAEPHE